MRAFHQLAFNWPIFRNSQGAVTRLAQCGNNFVPISRGVNAKKNWVNQLCGNRMIAPLVFLTRHSRYAPVIAQVELREFSGLPPIQHFRSCQMTMVTVQYYNRTGNFNRVGINRIPVIPRGSLSQPITFCFSTSTIAVENIPKSQLNWGEGDRITNIFFHFFFICQSGQDLPAQLHPMAHFKVRNRRTHVHT